MKCERHRLTQDPKGVAYFGHACYLCDMQSRRDAALAYAERAELEGWEEAPRLWQESEGLCRGYAEALTAHRASLPRAEREALEQEGAKAFLRLLAAGP